MDVVRTEAETGLIEIAGSSKIDGPSWFADLQAKARDEFQNLGLPHRRVEEWKYTDLKSSIKTAPPMAQTAGDVSGAAIDQALGNALASLDAHRLVIVDGQFNKSLSDPNMPENIEVLSLRDALKSGESWIENLGQVGTSERDAVQALNLAEIFNPAFT